MKNSLRLLFPVLSALLIAGPAGGVERTVLAEMFTNTG